MQMNITVTGVSIGDDRYFVLGGYFFYSLNESGYFTTGNDYI